MHPYITLNNPALSLEQRIEAILKGVSHRTQMRFALWCARSVEDKLTDKRSKDALDTLERYIDGHATKVEMKLAIDAADAAYTAAYTAYAYASADATAADAYAATYASAAASYASYASYAAYAAASAASKSRAKAGEVQLAIQQAQLAKLIELMEEEPLW